MQTETFTGWNNQSFVLTLDMTQWLAVFPNLALGSFTAALVDAAAIAKPGRPLALAFSSNSGDSAAGAATYSPNGTYVVDATTNPPTTKTVPVLALTASANAVGGLLGLYNYDILLALNGNVYGVLGGQITMLAGATPSPPP